MTRRPQTYAGLVGSSLDPDTSLRPRRGETAEQTVERVVEAVRAESLGPCRWFALCQREATLLVDHPVLGFVPSCERCQQVTS